MRHFPIRWTLPLLAGGLPLAVAGLVLFAAYRQVRAASLELAEQQLVGALSTLTSRLTTQFRGAEAGVHRVASDPVLARFLRNPTPALAEVADTALDRALPQSGSTILVQLVDGGGRPLSLGTESARSIAPPNPSELSALTAGLDSAGIGAIRAMRDTMIYPIVASITEGGDLLGYLVAWQLLATRTGEAEAISQMVGPGVVLYYGSEGGAWLAPSAPVPEPGWDFSRTEQLQRYQAANGSFRLATVSRISGSPWIMALAQPEDSVLAGPRRFLAGVGGAVVLVGILGLAVGMVLSRQITRPLGQLVRAADGMRVDGPSVAVTARDGDEPAVLVGAFNRMAERVRAEVAARGEAEAQWRLLFAENPHPMWVFDEGTLAFLAVNEAAIESYGYDREVFLTMTVRDIRPPEEVPALEARLADVVGKQEGPVTFRHRRKDGTDLQVEVRSRPLMFDGRRARLVLAQDVTASLALEAAFRQAQKMEAVGRLAGGIAHDFNNLLAVIMTYTDLAREELPPGDPRAAELGMVSGAAEKAHALTRQLLAFSRQQVVQPAVLDPNQGIAGIEVLIQRLLGEDIVMELRLDPAAGRIRIDPGQFEQVVMNLAVNARDAMPRGGALTITTAGTEIDEESRVLHGLSRTGAFVLISVSDTGTGMTPETLARLFEPFFTTKEVGKGTGLGLATLYGIVTQAGGSVTVYSEWGMGSTFRIYLPQVSEPAESPRAGPRMDAMSRGTETILLVEDDAAVRAAATAVLERLGYTVLAAQGAEDAFALVAHHGSGIALVVSDVVMPGTDGPALVEALRRRNPGLKVLLMSGYAGDVITRRGLPEGQVAFLEKPFTAALLAQKVREVLGPA